MMRVDRIETVLPCISDPWKLRIILYLDHQPDISSLHEYLGGRQSKSLGVLTVRSGGRELNIFATGKVTVREVNDVDEAESLVNHLLAMVEHRKFIREESE
ncbi:MAG: hypothetical protein M8353_09260 [ANME-2 cluster archaeon]|nr:hypothetical protein [ANME-2 cluster archaeon]